MWTFNPILKSVIWGGEKIIPFKNLDDDKKTVGESWEISGVEGSESVVKDGTDAGLTISQLIDKYGDSLLGKKNHKRFGNRFPILIKFIDAYQDLSVQVHPNDEIARKHGYDQGKNEMWFILEAQEDAKIINGFKRPVNPEEYSSLIKDGKLIDVLNFHNIKPGEAYFIPAGRVHGIGKGSFLAEIQQTSDITFRLYDYNRKDKDGKERQLHIEEAFEAINFNDTNGEAKEYHQMIDIPVNLFTTPHFTTNLLKISNKVMRDYSEWDTFVILIGIKGSAKISAHNTSRTLKAGESMLIPASCRNIVIYPEESFEALETYIK